MTTTALRCEYVWLDGAETPSLRSKTRILSVETSEEEWTLDLKDVPLWSFDGSSTGQSSTKNSDLILRPVFACTDSNRTGGVIVLCDVLNTDLTPHSSNSRAKLIDSMIRSHKTEPVVGFEQEYFMYDGEAPLGWSSLSGEDMDPQGKYYCGVGSGNVSGRSLSELHLNSCINSGLSIVGVNAEVALGQWEYQIGGPGVNAVAACDHLWVSRYILERAGELQGVSINFDPKPIEGNWNGSGMHTNFSTRAMREEGGMTVIENACNALSSKESVDSCLSAYGEGLSRRLTGNHETCSVDEFRVGVADRSASVRIPVHVAKNERGYFEDRRPNSNADPYRVTTALIDVVCPLEGPVDEG